MKEFNDLENAISKKDIIEILSVYSELLEGIVNDMEKVEVEDINKLMENIQIKRNVYSAAEEFYNQIQKETEFDMLQQKYDKLKKIVEEYQEYAKEIKNI
ncbi:hypothetical protein SLOPH_906 [Spraguea lophii 42_110]|uniref:Uncharacterized protein n=1 Tax=Spraguea lophii (strain 42_110) TaxID=1358809 RepID=S7XLT7_SPRLO|nr:hypothetical protein SLOPH_906 [Spraguea lophii 42_110]